MQTKYSFIILVFVMNRCKSNIFFDTINIISTFFFVF